MSLDPLPVHLSSPRLELSSAGPFAEDEGRVLLAQLERFLLYLPDARPLAARTRGQAFLDAVAAMLVELRQRGAELAYCVRRRDDGQFVGHASAHAISVRDGCAELAYWVCEQAQGQGYVGEAVGALEAALFERGFHRVEIRCDVENQASARVARRAGYRLEGTLREHMRRPDGSYRSSHVFGKLRAEAERA